MIESKDQFTRSIVWCLTINNYTDEDEQAFLSPKIKYYVYGREVGESGTPHLQAYVILYNQMKLHVLKKTLFPRAHLEVRRGSHEQARDYCIKDGNFEEGGTPPISKKRQGEMGAQVYHDAIQAAKEGRFDDIPDPIYLRYYRTLKEIRKDYQVMPEANDELTNEWYYGKTGSGKSRKAREDNPGAYIKNCNKWWDGYVDQEVVIIDEWGPEHECLATHLKLWGDHHPFQAETKGGSICIRPNKIIVTSNYSIDQCFMGSKDGVLDPIKRRFNEVSFDPPRPAPTGFEQFLKK